MLHTTEVMAIFLKFLPILAIIWLPWQRPLDPCNQKCLLWIGRARKPPVVSHRILVIFRRNAFICIYSKFCPKIGCYGNTPLSLEYGSFRDEFADSTNLISKPNSASMCRLQLMLWPFLWHLTYFGQNLVAMTTFLRPLRSPVVSNRILVISRRNAFICIYSNFSPKIGCHDNALCPSCTGVS